MKESFALPYFRFSKSETLTGQEWYGYGGFYQGRPFLVISELERPWVVSSRVMVSIGSQFDNGRNDMSCCGLAKTDED